MTPMMAARLATLDSPICSPKPIAMPPASSPSSFRLALALAASSFTLLLLGAIVHGTGSGLACQDWPLCRGSILPTSTIDRHLVYDLLHRFAAAAVALLTVALALRLIRRGDRLTTRLALAALGLVVVEVVLGAWTVSSAMSALAATAHLAASLAFFTLAILLVLRTLPLAATADAAIEPQDRRWLLAGAAAVYVEMIVGGLVRHLGAGLACRDWPLCQGSLLPWSESGLVLLQAGHRLLAVAMGVLVVVAAWRAARAKTARPLAVRILVWTAPSLVVVQSLVGMLSVVTRLDIIPATMHLALATLLLGDLAALALADRLRPQRLLSPLPRVTASGGAA